MIMINIEDIIDFLATKEVLILLAIISLIMFVYFILWFHEFLKKREEKKKLQNNTIELNKLVEQVNAENTKIEIDKNVESNEVVEISDNKSTIGEKVKEESFKDLEPVVEISTLNTVSSPVDLKPIVINVSETKVNANDTIMLNNKFEEKVEILDPDVINPVKSPKNEEEVIKYKDEVYTEIEAKAELTRIKEELEKIEEEKEDNIELTKFETEQEENAIISLDELIAKGKDISKQNEITQYQDDGNEPISIQELEEIYRKEKIEVLEQDQNELKPKLSIDDFLTVKPKEEVLPLKDAYSQSKNIYRPSPIISPIYGIEEEPAIQNTTLELENTANLQKFDEEMRKTNEFLSKLKELQEKLD